MKLVANKEIKEMSRSPKQKKQKTLSEFFGSVSRGEKSGENVTTHSIETPATTSPVIEQVSSSSSSLVSSTPAQQLNFLVLLDIGNFIPQSNVDNQTKYDYLTNYWKPQHQYKFPRVERKVKNKTVYLSFQHEWLRIYNWLAYSPSQNGAFCKYYRIFAPEEAGGARLKVFVKTPMRNLKDAKADMTEHSRKSYHFTAKLRAEDFVKLHTSENVVEQMLSARSQQAASNCRGLLSIIDTIKLCGRQNIALRGTQRPWSVRQSI